MSRKKPTVVGEIMSKPVITIRYLDVASNALAVMADKNVGAIIVVGNGNTPVGILTERDVLKYMIKQTQIPKDPLVLPVSLMMSSPLITCEPDTPITEAYEMMHEKGIRRLPVLDKGKLVGIVTERDIIFWMFKRIMASDLQ